MTDDDKALVERLKWEMRLAENLLSDCQKHLYGEGIAPPENVIAGIRERLKCSLGRNEMTEITQADRDAAARAWAEDNDEPLDCYICEQIRAGYGDNSLDVIRFARHRMEERAAIVAWLMPYDPAIAEDIEDGAHLK